MSNNFCCVLKMGFDFRSFLKKYLAPIRPKRNVWCKFVQNRFSGIERNYTDMIGRHTDMLYKPLYEFSLPQNEYFHRKNSTNDQQAYTFIVLYIIDLRMQKIAVNVKLINRPEMPRLEELPNKETKTDRGLAERFLQSVH